MYTEKSYSILKHLAKGKNKKGQEMRTKIQQNINKTSMDIQKWTGKEE
jgi:hypothetical protein